MSLRRSPQELMRPGRFDNAAGDHGLHLTTPTLTPVFLQIHTLPGFPRLSRPSEAQALRLLSDKKTFLGSPEEVTGISHFLPLSSLCL